MTITTEQTRLVDEQAKAKFTETYGYDYNASSAVQQAIQNVVESELTLADLSQAGSPVRMIPALGDQLEVNGVRYAPTQQDLDAYTAAHPQNAAIPSERQRIIERLENPTAQPDSSQPPAQTTIAFKRYPQNKVATILEYDQGSRFYYENPDYGSIERRIASADAGKEFEVLEAFVQRKDSHGNFHKIFKEGKELYILTKDMNLSDDFRKSFFEDDSKKPSTTAPKDWTLQPTDVPYYEPYDASWRVSVLLEHTEMTNEDSIMQEAYNLGVPILFKNSAKKNDPDYINGVKDKSSAQALEWFLSPTPGSRIKVLVSIPQLSVLSLENAPDPQAFVFEMVCDMTNLKERIKKASSNIRALSAKISKYDGKVTSFDAAKEADKFESIYDQILFIFKENNIDIKNKKIKLYWTSEYVPVKITLLDSTSNVETPAIKSFQQFLAKNPIKSKRTQKLFFNLPDLETMSMPWTDFIKNYVSYKNVKMVPNGVKSTTQKKKAAIKPPVKTPAAKEIEDRYIKDPKRQAVEHEKRVPQSDETGSSFIDKKKYPKLSRELDIVMDNVPTADMEDIYTKFLNNVDFKEILLEAAQCLISGQTGQTFNKLQNDFKVLKAEKEKIENVMIKKGYDGALKSIPTMFYPTDFPTDDISAEFVKSLRKSLSAALNQIIKTLVQNILNSLINFCPDDDEASLPTSEIGSAPAIDFAGLQAKINELFDDVSEEDLSALFEDLATQLSPDELCSLLEGEPSDRTLNTVLALIESQYCHLGLETKDQIEEFFAALGESLDLSFCDDIRQAIIPDAPDDFLCPPDDSIREGRLLSRGLTPDQIRRQLDAERDRARRIAEDFLRQATGEIEAPNLFCSKDAEGNIKEGIVPFMDDQFIYSLRTTIESTFESTYNSFSEEGAAYAATLSENVPYRIITSKPNKIFPNIIEYDIEDITIREPLPDLMRYYKSPSLEALTYQLGSSITSEVILRVPNTMDKTIDDAQSMLDNRINDPCPPEDGDADELADLLTVLRQAGADSGVKEVRLYEYKDMCAWDIARKNNLPTESSSTTPSARDTIPQPQDPVSVTTPCSDEPEPTVQPTFPSEPESQDFQPENIEPRTPTHCDDPGNDRSSGYSISVGDTNLFYEKKISSEDMDYLDDGVTPTGRNFFERIYQASEQAEYVNHTTPYEFSQPPSVPPGNPQSRDTILGMTYDQTKKGILNQMFNILGAGNSSNPNDQRSLNPYLRGYSPSGTREYRLYTGSVPPSLPDDADADNLYLHLKELFENAPVKISHDQCGLDFVDLGPKPTPQCDPHLLKIRQVMDEILRDFQKDMCLDMSAEDVPGDRPRKTPLEAALVSAAIKVTLRHYIIETLVTGLITLSSLEGTSKINSLKFDYIYSKMKQKMSNYGDNYFSEFVTQAIDVYKGMKDGKTDHELIIKMLKEEYAVIKSGLLASILLQGSEADRRASAGGFKSLFMKDIWKNNQLSFNRPKGLNRHYRSVVNNEGRIMPHWPVPTNGEMTEDLFFKIKNESAPIIIERHPHGITTHLVVNGVDIEDYHPGTSSAFQYASFINGEETLTRFLIPINSYTFENTGTIQQGRDDIRRSAINNGFRKWFTPPQDQLRPGDRDYYEYNHTEPEDWFMAEDNIRRLLSVCFPLDVYSTLFSIHEMETSSKQLDVSIAFGNTRDDLFSVFLAVLPEWNDWQKQDKALSENGGLAGVKEAFTYNSNFMDIPCTDFAFNGGMDVCWGNPFKGLSMKFMLRAARDAALLIVKSWIQANDPNIRLASALSFLTKLACVNIPTSAISGLISASMPWMTTQFTVLYNAMGLGLFASAELLGSDSKEGENARNFIKGTGLSLPQFCGDENQEESDALDEATIRGEEDSYTAWLIDNEEELREELLEIAGESIKIQARIGEIEALQANAQAFFANPFTQESRDAASVDLKALGVELESLFNRLPPLERRQREIEKYLSDLDARRS